jgi:predicted ATPase
MVIVAQGSDRTGTGKTSLALEVAADLRLRFPDGIVFVNLAPISNPAFVLPTISKARLRAWLGSLRRSRGLS